MNKNKLIAILNGCEILRNKTKYNKKAIKFFIFDNGDIGWYDVEHHTIKNISINGNRIYLLNERLIHITDSVICVKSDYLNKRNEVRKNKIAFVVNGVGETIFNAVN